MDEAGREIAVLPVKACADGEDTCYMQLDKSSGKFRLSLDGAVAAEAAAAGEGWRLHWRFCGAGLLGYLLTHRG